jgi:hypothetical protein
MTRMASRTSTLLASGAAMAIVAALLPWSASCATTQSDAPPPDEASTLPGQDATADGGALDGDVDGGCDASDDTCVTRPVTCEETAWCPVPTPVTSQYALTSTWGSSKNDVWAAGSGGTIIHYDGAAWKATPTGLKHTFNALWGTSATDVWAVAAGDVILHSDGFANGAGAWTRAAAAVDENFALPVFAVWGTATGELRLGGRSFNFQDADGNFGSANQLVAHAVADGGVAWTPTGGSAVVHGIWGSSADDVWIVADNRDAASWQLGYTAHGRRAGDGGTELAWTEVDSQSSVVLGAIWGSSANDVWAVGDKGTLRHITTSATQWQVIESPTTEALHGVWGTGPADVWAVGDFGTILHFDGMAWSASTAAFAVGKKRPHLYGVWGSGPSDVWIVGDGVALHYTGPKSAAGGGGK